MNKSLRITLVIFFLHSVQSAGYIVKDYSELCSKQDYSHPKLFYQLPERTEISVSCDQIFRDGRPLGKGSFGEVKKVSFPMADGTVPRVAMKKMTPRDSWEKNQILTEISALNAAASSKYTPRLYGCSITSTNVYLIQTFLAHDLDNVNFRTKIAGQTCAQSLALYLQMFIGLKDLWDAGFVHNDIKPANMMANDDDSQVFLIDFGLAQLNTAGNKGMGTPIFMPPSKFSGYGTVSQKDDMYSVALSIAVLEAPRSYDAVFAGNIRNYKGACFEKHNDAICRTNLIKNVKPILQNAGYGTYQTSATKSTINFTTLLINIIDYDSFNWTYKDVIEIIERLIGADETAKANKAREEEAARLREEAKRAEALRANIKNNRKVEREVKQDYEAALKEQAGVLLKQGLVKGGNNDDARKRLQAMQAQKEADELKLKKLQLNDEFKRNELQKIEYQAREGSEIYNQNKALFKRQPVVQEEVQAPVIQAPIEKIQPKVEPQQHHFDMAGEFRVQPKVEQKQPAINMAGEYRVQAKYAQDPQVNVKKPSLGAKPVGKNMAGMEQRRVEERLQKLLGRLVRNKRNMYPYFPGILELANKGYLKDSEIDWEDQTYRGVYRIRI